MKKSLWLLSLLIITLMLVGCNSDIIISPNITVEGESVNYIGYVGSNAGPQGNNPPNIYDDVEVTVVKPSSIVNINYEEMPKNVYLMSWFNGELFEERKKLDELKINVPSDEGIYIYDLSARWNSRTAGSVVFVLEVKE
ncbi:hypothetical protein AWH56_018390 [Anaerobacillus isosaccharinicus]|uniref:DUF3221 domain-containing protein n=1 Tax=Anaerobacillus isosaccharinicus TaxID=1532552 RepID=A0A1S2LEB8_9BACI|nr:hypothetical protein [Anaerobacillus isosaccharinicus]MBA5587126.1 hypothetical protein [Anaerobacillus isosaccharinicus]QOY34678.1 hypothetical protein AWH56_018390 [Anaerobacillus isosaccharinicus]